LRIALENQLKLDSSRVIIKISRIEGVFRCYLSGPSAKDYLDENIFMQSTTKVEQMDYNNYPKYQQVFEPFERGITI